MRKKVLLCGEGPLDYGIKEYGTDNWKEGPVQPITRKSAAESVVFENVEKSEIRRLRIQRGPTAGHAVKSYKLCVLARKRRIFNIICYADADKIPGRGRKEVGARAAFQSVYNQVREGFVKFNENFRSNNQNRIVGIPMVPLRMIESWLLSDEEAFNKCFGKVPSDPRLPGKPELIWGDKHDPGSDYPKHLMERALKQYHKKSNREVFKRIAEEIDIDVLRKQCPISFETFYNDIQRELRFLNSP